MINEIFISFKFLFVLFTDKFFMMKKVHYISNVMGLLKLSVINSIVTRNDNAINRLFKLIVCSSAKGLGNAGGKEFDLLDISNTCSMSAALTYPIVGDLSKSLVIMVMMRSLDLFRESLLPVMV